MSMRIKNRHDNTSFDTAVSLKKVNFNTTSKNPFFKKEKGGFDCYFKTAASHLNS
jgi:hypothetical protein